MHTTAGGHDAARLRSRITVADVVFDVSVVDTDDLTLVSRVLGDEQTERPADVVLEIGRAVTVPSRIPDFEGPYGDHWDDGETHHFRHSWGLTMSADAEGIRLGGPASGFDRWVTIRNSMLFALARVFLARDRFLLHAAATRHGDDAIVVVGDSGSGKSTLAWSAARHGWDVLGDDMVVIDRAIGKANGEADSSLRVQGIPRVPSVPGEVARSERIDGDTLPGDERERVELAGFTLDRRPCDVTAVVVCSHSDGAATLDPLAGHEAMQALVPAFVLSALEDPLRKWFPLAAQLSKSPCWQFGHAADPAHRVAEAGHHLTTIVPSSRSDDRSQNPNRPEATASR